MSDLKHRLSNEKLPATSPLLFSQKTYRSSNLRKGDNFFDGIIYKTIDSNGWQDTNRSRQKAVSSHRERKIKSQRDTIQQN